MKKILWLLIAILTIQTGYSIGVGPAFNTLEYQPNTIQSDYLKVYNTEDKEFYAVLSVEGGLKEYLILDDTQIYIPSNEDFKRIYYHVQYPELEPGSYQTRIRIIETPQNVEGESVIIAALGVSHKIGLEVSAYGKYLKISFVVEDKTLKVTLDNIGEEDVEQVDIEFTLTDDKQSLVYEETASNINVGQKQIITRNLKKVEDGVYQALLNVTYDGINKIIKQEIAIGQIIVTINSMDIADFEIGDIAKIDLEVENKWNRELNNLNLEMEVVRNNKIYGSYKSEDFNLAPNSKKTISAYWDTQDKPVGDYDAHFTVNYAGKKAEQSFILTLGEEKVTAAKPKEFNWLIPISIIAVIMLIVVILLLVRYFKQKGEPVIMH